MQTEFEVRLLEIDVAKITDILNKLNAELVFDRLQRRYVYDFNPKINGKWIRLRTKRIRN